MELEEKLTGYHVLPMASLAQRLDNTRLTIGPWVLMAVVADRGTAGMCNDVLDNTRLTIGPWVLMAVVADRGTAGVCSDALANTRLSI